MKRFNNNENNSFQFAQISQKNPIIDFNRVLNTWFWIPVNLSFFKIRNSKLKMIPKIESEWKYTLKDVSRTLSNIYDDDFLQNLLAVFTCYYFHREAQSQMYGQKQLFRGVLRKTSCESIQKTSMMELLCKNIQQLKTTTHFFKKLHQRCFAGVTPLIMNVARYWESIPNKTEIPFSVLAKKTQLALVLLDNNRTYEMKSRTNEKNAFMLEKANRTKQLINQPHVSATEFMNNQMPHTLFETLFFLKAYQNPYVNSQLNNQKFTQRRRQQRLLTCNTQSSKG